MRALPLLLLLLLGACAVTPPVVKPKPAPVTWSQPEVIIKTRRVVIVERKEQPDLIGPAILHAYARLRPSVDQAVVQSKRPAAIDHLTTLDRRVRSAMRPFMARHHKPTPGEVDEAISSLTELKVAAASTPKGP